MALRLDHLLELVAHPVRYLRFWRRTRQVRDERGVSELRFDWRVLPRVARTLRAQGVTHLHAHFAWGAAAAAHCLSPLMGTTWSMTVHANDIFVSRRNLGVKVQSCSALVTVCEYNRTWLREELGVSREIELVVCGVEVPPVTATAKTYDVVAVGRLVEKKGLDLLVLACATLRATHPHVRVAIIGEGPERAHLEQLVREHRLEDVVDLPGALSHEESLQRISEAQVFCLPARIARDGDRDAMPVVIKEAMAREVPVVATSVVAIPEMVDEQVGRLVPPDDVPALTAALDEVLSLSTDERAALGRAGRRRVLEGLTLAGETAKLRQLFRRVSA